MRLAFDTTVLWGAFHNPTGACFKLLALAAQRTPVLDGFITDAIGAEFWWRATQQGVKGPRQRVPRTYSEQELESFLDAFEVLIEPTSLARAPIGRTLGQKASLVGLPLGEFLHIVTGVDRQALLSSESLSFPVTFESVDIADLHVICGALQNGADAIIRHPIALGRGQQRRPMGAQASFHRALDESCATTAHLVSHFAADPVGGIVPVLTAGSYLRRRPDRPESQARGLAVSSRPTALRAGPP